MIRAFLSFDNFVFPRIGRVVYIIGLILIVLGMIGSVFSGVALLNSGEDGTTAGVFMIVGSVLGAIVSAIVWRLMIELWMVAFSINDHLRAIREQGLQK